MISLKELLGKAETVDVSPEIMKNLNVLLVKINRIRFLYGKPMLVTSGYRSMRDHLRIYRDIAEKKHIPFDESKVPMGSQHLYGAACDIYDPQKELQDWCIQNEDELVAVNLYMEDFSATPSWVHFQINPPKSGKRFFMP